MRFKQNLKVFGSCYPTNDKRPQKRDVAAMAVQYPDQEEGQVGVIVFGVSCCLLDVACWICDTVVYTVLQLAFTCT